MQFSCESCKTQLQIADEKVRGKRLIVRCKRCGAKIGISDPALGAPKPKPAAAKPAPAPAAAAPAPATGPIKRDSDTESTRAMDSDMLEKALEASKSDDPSPLGAAPKSAPPPPPSANEQPEWFAMLHGKQTGPMTRAELTAKTNEGAVGPRTYLWKDGMDSWQRAKDVGELSGLFPQLPEASAPPPSMPPPMPSNLREFSTPEFGNPVAVEKAAEKEKPPEPAPAPAAKEEDHTTVDPLPLGERVHQEAVAKELFPSGETSPVQVQQPEPPLELDRKPAPPPRPAPAQPMFASAAPPRKSPWPFIIVSAVIFGAIGAGLWLEFGNSGKSPAPAPAQEAKQEPQAPAPVQTVPAKPPETPPTPPDAKPPEAPPAKPPEAQTGLTADQVRKKLDENKGALQGCIDEALRRDPNLRVGKIHIATTIAPSGQVTSAKIDKATVDQSPLGACLRRATRRINFPQFAGDAFDVDIPIVVTAGE